MAHTGSFITSGRVPPLLSAHPLPLPTYLPSTLTFPCSAQRPQLPQNQSKYLHAFVASKFPMFFQVDLEKEGLDPVGA